MATVFESAREIILMLSKNRDAFAAKIDEMEKFATRCGDGPRQETDQDNFNFIGGANIVAIVMRGVKKKGAEFPEQEALLELRRLQDLALEGWQEVAGRYYKAFDNIPDLTVAKQVINELTMAILGERPRQSNDQILDDAKGLDMPPRFKIVLDKEGGRKR